MIRAVKRPTKIVVVEVNFLLPGTTSMTFWHTKKSIQGHHQQGISHAHQALVVVGVDPERTTQEECKRWSYRHKNVSCTKRMPVVSAESENWSNFRSRLTSVSRCSVVIGKALITALNEGWLSCLESEVQPSYSSSPRWSDNSRSSAFQWLNRAWPARKVLRDVDLTRNEYEELPALRQRPANKPLEWTGHLILSAAPPQAPCLPLRGSVRAPQRAIHATSLAAGSRLCRLLKEESHMATNLALDQDLLDRAFRVSGEPTKKAAVTRALQEFIARREQRRVAELFGKLEWDASFDYKAERDRQQ